MPIAEEIYQVFRERVRERVAQTNRLLEDPNFDFSKDESVMISRKEAEWPKNEMDAKHLWKLQIKEAVLSEMLRRELLTRLASEQHKPDPGSDDRSPARPVPGAGQEEEDHRELHRERHGHGQPWPGELLDPHHEHLWLDERRGSRESPGCDQGGYREPT